MKDSINIADNQPKYNKKLKRYINYPQLLELILKIDVHLKEAYGLKETYILFNQTASLETARADLAEVIGEFSLSNVESFRRFLQTLIDRFEEIVYFFHLYGGKRISNAKLEGTNSRIKTILKNANGFRNFSRMRNRIMYSINKEVLPTVNTEKQIIKQEDKKRGRYKKDSLNN